MQQSVLYAGSHLSCSTVSATSLGFHCSTGLLFSAFEGGPTCEATHHAISCHGLCSFGAASHVSPSLTLREGLVCSLLSIASALQEGNIAEHTVMPNSQAWLPAHRDGDGDAVWEADKLCHYALAGVRRERGCRGVALWFPREYDVGGLSVYGGRVLECVGKEAICEGLELLHGQVNEEM